MRRARAGLAAAAAAALGLAMAAAGAAPAPGAARALRASAPPVAAVAASPGAEAASAGRRRTGAAETRDAARDAHTGLAQHHRERISLAEAPGGDAQDTNAKAARPPGAGDAAPMDRAEALSALASAEGPERRLAVLRLSEIALAEDAPALVQALRDEDEVVRTAAEQALWALWGRSGDPAIDARLREGAALMGERRLDESIAVFAAIISERPDFAEAWNKRATALYLKGDYRASMADCAEVDRRNPSHFGMMAGMGQIWLRLGDLEKAEGWFARALEVNPNMTSVAALLEATRAERHRRGRRDT